MSLHKGPTKRENIESGLLWWDLKKKKVAPEYKVRTMSPTWFLFAMVGEHFNLCL